MNISIITGSRVVADNVTSLYTFALGIVAGGFLAVGVGEVDVAHDMGGDGLRVYLAVLTAMVGGGIGLFVSRFGDRIADRRQTRRRINIAVMRMQLLGSELFELHRVATDLLSKGMLLPPGRVHLATLMISVGRAAVEGPDFDDIVDNQDDIWWAQRASTAFLTVRSICPVLEIGSDYERAYKLAADTFNDVFIAGIGKHSINLRDAATHFLKKM